MDFIEGLPVSGRFNSILVIVNLFLKYAHFVGLRHPFTTASVASLFMQQVYRLHGMPSAIVSDRDRIFTSKLWTELFKPSQVDLRMSTAYHPQSDRQTERFNQCLETFLRRYVHACPSKWSDWRHLAEYWYNCSFILLWAAPRLKLFTGMRLLTLVFRLLMLLFQRILNHGLKNVN